MCKDNSSRSYYRTREDSQLLQMNKLWY